MPIRRHLPDPQCRRSRPVRSPRPDRSLDYPPLPAGTSRAERASRRRQETRIPFRAWTRTRTATFALQERRTPGYAIQAPKRTAGVEPASTAWKAATLPTGALHRMCWAMSAVAGMTGLEPAISRVTSERVGPGCATSPENEVGAKVRIALPPTGLHKQKARRRLSFAPVE